MGGMGMGMAARKPAWEMPIEFYGVVYLYNPVSIDRLGLNKVTEDTVVDATVTEAAAPDVQPAAANGQPNDVPTDAGAPAASATAPTADASANAGPAATPAVAQ